MGNNITKNAPQLIIEGDKWIEDNELRISVADRLITAIATNKNLTSNDRLLLIVLLGQAATGFYPAEKWVLNHTGMDKKTYHRCRQRLIEQGIMDFQEYKYMKIFIDNIEQEAPWLLLMIFIFLYY